ncbi:HNH endonuclease signature motif containing protein [Muribacter muris]|uniref:HNH endonuclease signature motif containing protein n=1 Tax=Muribacter muris TaxID=67855 RepID=UPI001ADD8FD9|nr:HNH endonuclease signature motif containing protein [Muribacter muris]
MGFLCQKKKSTKPARDRDYDKEYRTYHGTPEQIANRSARNKARRVMEKEVGKSALKGKEVDHKKPLSKGGSNARSNLQVLSKTANRKKGNK